MVIYYLKDILNAKIVTHGVCERVYEVNTERIHFIDVSGRKNNRKIWSSLFGDISTIFFVVSLAGYDQVLSADDKTNRMLESMDVFNEIINCKTMPTQNMILFLNKKDLFQTKLKTSNIKDYFPSFGGIFI